MTPTNEAKHTPGPWRIDADQVADEATRKICERYGIQESRGTGILGDIKQHEHNESYSVVAVVNDNLWECEANANLIAAAPELLTALRDIVVSAHNGNEPGQTWITIAGGLIDSAEAAIRKALTGQA
jgi:hypothetical protein